MIGTGARKIPDPSTSLRESFNGEETIIASSPLPRPTPCLEAHLIVIAHPLEACLGRRYSLTPGMVLEVGRTADAEIG